MQEAQLHRSRGLAEPFAGPRAPPHPPNTHFTHSGLPLAAVVVVDVFGCSRTHGEEGDGWRVRLLLGDV